MHLFLHAYAPRASRLRALNIRIPIIIPTKEGGLEIRGLHYHFRGPLKKKYSILESILGLGFWGATIKTASKEPAAWSATCAACASARRWPLISSRNTPEHIGVSQKKGYLVGGPHNEDYNILGFLGFILRSPIFWETTI